MPVQPPKGPTVRVTSYTRRDGTKVRSHDRRAQWRKAAAAWAGAGITGLTTAALVLEFGLTFISTLMIVLTAALGFVAVKASQHADSNRAKMRAKVKARTTTRPRPAPRRR